MTHEATGESALTGLASFLSFKIGLVFGIFITITDDANLWWWDPITGLATARIKTFNTISGHKHVHCWFSLHSTSKTVFKVFAFSLFHYRKSYCYTACVSHLYWINQISGSLRGEVNVNRSWWLESNNITNPALQWAWIKNKTNKQKLSYAKTNSAASVQSICKIYLEFHTHNKSWGTRAKWNKMYK